MEPLARVDCIQQVFRVVVALNADFFAGALMTVFDHDAKGEVVGIEDQRSPDQVTVDGIPRAPRPASTSRRTPNSSWTASTS